MCACVAFVCVHFVAVCFLFVSSVCCVYIYESECLCGKNKKNTKQYTHAHTLSIFRLVSGLEVSLAIKSHYRPTKWT